MSLWRLVPCLTLLLPSLGFAQTPDEWTPYTPPAEEPALPPPLVPAPPVPRPPPPQPPPAQPPPPRAPEQEPSQEERISQDLIALRAASTQRAVRLVSLPFTGAITGMMGVILGSFPTAVIALPLCLGTDDFGSDPTCAIAVGTGLSVSYSVGVTLGVTLVGNRLGGQGDGVLTFLSALAGSALGSGIGIASQSTGVLILGMVVGPLIGATVGYELSHTVAMQPAGPELQDRSGFQVMPVIGATPGGGILGGFAGRF
ncbi:MAG TPA: hypothetical protein VNA24_11810 [Hyalangium sp.]|nr:hypothetical protein [Hyalangium sp.]